MRSLKRWFMIAAALVASVSIASQTGGAQTSCQPATPVSLGMRLAAEGHPDQALTILEAEVARSPGDPKLGLARAQCLMDLGRWQEGLSAGQTLMQKFPGDVEIRIMVGEALFVLFHPLDAVETWRPLLKDADRAAEVLPRMLSALMAVRRFDEARKLVSEAKNAGIPFDDVTLSFAAQAAADERGRLDWLRALLQRYPDNARLAEEVRLCQRVWELGGESVTPPASYPSVIRLSSNGLYMPATAGRGGRLNLFFDTGSESLKVGEKVIGRAGGTAIGEGAVAGMGESGARLLPRAVLPRIRFGGLQVSNTAVFVGLPVTGLGPFLGGVTVWDRRRSRFTLWPAGTSPEKALGVAEGQTLPVLFVRGVPLVQILVNGKGPYPFLLDTGASSTILADQFAALLGVHVNSAKYRPPVGKGASGMFLGGFAENVVLALGDDSIPYPWIWVSEVPQRFTVPVYGILGRDVLLGYRILFDGPNARITLVRYSGGLYRNPLLNRPPTGPATSRPSRIPQYSPPQNSGLGPTTTKKK